MPKELMTAVVQDRYGEADVLYVDHIPRPTVADNEVLIRVEAASVDRGAWHLMAGLPYPLRLAGFGLRRPRNRVRGLDVSGRVEAVGSSVTRVAVGQEVYGIAVGSFAEYARALETKIAAKPARLSFAQAAAVPVSALTALQAVRDHGRVQAGQSALVLGASGGVGIYAVQVAKAMGAHVTGVCSTSKTDTVRSIGADEVLDYRVDDATDGSHRYDVIIDTGGNRRLRDLRRALTRTGTLVIVGGENGGRWLGGTDRQIRAQCLSPFISQKMGTFIASENADDLEVLTQMINAGDITPVIDSVHPLADTAVAVARMVDGSGCGKQIIATR
ncbi:NAD(P)-dependent alcohol dehydrogenase [Rhodococcus qingshengii]|uniref:NAD(P)-dependent alcohol dehydrogenase n=1 Tax=Rhodococcus qingshengii TaxID=334542 RepID=UPI00279A1BFE|nr:NAD(P)-dependent alcohol dehydrogenase [Rhodococcus qingshengii]